MGNIGIDNPRIEIAKNLFVPATAKVGTVFFLPSGVFIVKKPIVVPADSSLEGAGAMTFGPGDRPAGFAPGSATVLKADPSLVGDILALSDGARVSGVRIEDVSRVPPTNAGNLIVVSSSKPGDRVAATVEDCELSNPNGSGQSVQRGPTGRAVLVFTRNLNADLAPPPDTESLVGLFMRHSIIESTGGGSGVFAINFASRSRVVLRLAQNVIGGGLDATGGVSRPDAVANSQVVIFSMLNQYRNDASSGQGWSLRGGANPPGPAFRLPGITTVNNTLFIQSINDEITGFDVGIHAAAGWRPFYYDNSGTKKTGTVNQNRVSLILTNLKIGSVIADIELFGATAGQFGPSGSDPASFTPGDDNQLQAVFSFGGGSAGVRANRYAHADMVQTGLAKADAGSGNRLQIHGIPAFNIAPSADFLI